MLADFCQCDPVHHWASVAAVFDKLGTNPPSGPLVLPPSPPSLGLGIRAQDQATILRSFLLLKRAPPRARTCTPFRCSSPMPSPISMTPASIGRAQPRQGSGPRPATFVLPSRSRRIIAETTRRKPGHPPDDAEQARHAQNGPKGHGGHGNRLCLRHPWLFGAERAMFASRNILAVFAWRFRLRCAEARESMPLSQALPTAFSSGRRMYRTGTSSRPPTAAGAQITRPCSARRSLGSQRCAPGLSPRGTHCRSSCQARRRRRLLSLRRR